MKFELFVAFRYLRARSRQAVVSVATLVSVAGVMAGVGALNVALALNEGIQHEFLTRILSATPHISVRSLVSAVITDYEEVARKLRSLPEVRSVRPSVSEYTLFESRYRTLPAILKGIDWSGGEEVDQVRNHIVEGNLDAFGTGERPVVALGRQLAAALEVKVGDSVDAIGMRGEVSPKGRLPRKRYFQVDAIYETGLWDYDYNLALISLPQAQSFFGYQAGQASLLELRIADIDEANQVAARIRDRLDIEFGVDTWIELNRPLFSALRLEKLALMIAIGLIILVAALNIVSTLTLMVREKNRDIAIIGAMGGTAAVLQKVFMLQGLIIGAAGTLLGTLLGLAISGYLDANKLLPLDPQIYQIPYVPFRSSFSDALLIGLAAIVISFAATIYPARAASRLDPVVALRNE